MKVHYPKLYNMVHLSLNVFTAFKGSNNYILFTLKTTIETFLKVDLSKHKEKKRSQVMTLQYSRICLSTLLQ